MRACRSGRGILAVHILVFERLHERFAEGVVVRVSFPTRTDRDLTLLQQAGGFSVDTTVIMCFSWRACWIAICVRGSSEPA